MDNDTVTIISFTGPSGSGKSELIRGLTDMYPDHCTMWQQFTTRRRRGPNDRYVFITPEKYHAMRELLTVRTEFGGNFYGTMPEAGAEGKAVLTIADRVGHADLAETVERHNRALEHNARAEGGAPRATPLGSSRVRLFSVLVLYSPTEESVEARGRASRGLDFVMGELRGLVDFRADLTLDTTESWPDPEKFFADTVWPLIAPRDWPELAQQEIEKAYEILAMHPEVAEDIHSMLSRWRAEFERPPSDGFLEASGAPPAAGPPAAPEPADATDAALLEAVGGAPPAAPEPIDLQEAASNGPPAALEELPVDGQLLEASERMARLRAEAEAAPPPAPPAAAEPATEEPPPAPPPAPPQTGPRFRTLRDLISGADFESFIISTRTGQTGFSSHAYFETMFRRYMLASGAVFPGRLDFGTPEPAVDPTDPKRQARVRRFEVKHTYNGQEEIFLIDFSERLLRPTSGGRVVGRVDLNS